MSYPYRQAMVIGGSMAGLLTARILAEHFERVIIVERDRLPSGPELRNGVPQARHLHLLLARGAQILEELFPGFGAELEAAGAPSIHWGKEAINLLASGWTPIFESSVKTRSASRAFLEWHVRQRLLSNARIQVMEGYQVDGLLTTPDKTRITGLQVKARGSQQGEQNLDADLIVDASGRGSHTPEWLETLGYGHAPETEINSFLGYATRWYKHPPSFPAALKMMIIGSRPPDFLSGGGIIQVEHDQWIVTLAGVNKNYPPTDEAGFLEFARNLLSPELYNVIKDAEPTSDIYGYQRTANQWRHYEQLERWPESFAVIGDAACAFNPIYGQGMTTGALSAMTLKACLDEQAGKPLNGLGQRFQGRLAKVLETPWLMATGEDLRYPGTVGGNPGWSDRLVQKYIDRVIQSGASSTVVMDSFMRVMSLLEAPTTLFAPRIVLQVVGDAFKPKPSEVGAFPFADSTSN